MAHRVDAQFLAHAQAAEEVGHHPMADIAGTPTAVEAVLAPVFERWHQDAGSTYRNWFHWEERLKNVRSIRRGLQAVVQEIETGAFGNTFIAGFYTGPGNSVTLQRYPVTGGVTLGPATSTQVMFSTPNFPYSDLLPLGNDIFTLI